MAQVQDVKVSQHGLFRYLVCDKCEKDAMRLYPVPGMGNYCEPCRNITEFETRHYALEGQFQAASDDYHQIIDNIAESTLALLGSDANAVRAELLNYECLSQRGLDMAELSFIRESKHRDGNAWRVLSAMTASLYHMRERYDDAEEKWNDWLEDLEKNMTILLVGGD